MYINKSEGINTYRIKPIILQHHNADELLANLEQKQQSGRPLTKDDLIPLVLSPLMNGSSSIKDRINKAYRIIGKTTELKKDDTAKMEAMLYAMADKFLNAIDLGKLKEEISMTRLGQMIWEDGRADGMAAGREEGKIAILLELIKDGLLTVKDASIRLGISETEIEKLLNENPQFIHN